MPRSAPKSSPCAVNQLLPVLAGPWTLHILWVLGNDGPARFGELRRKIEGISARMLSERLRLLEDRGFVYRHYPAGRHLRHHRPHEGHREGLRGTGPAGPQVV
jgi:DNA-binding HxlR family transcriptional regulator